MKATICVLPFALLLTLLGVAPQALSASSKSSDLSRIHHATQVFEATLQTPDKGIPVSILRHAQCLGIIPGEKKFALGFGGNYGKGIVTCRTTRDPSGWTAPLFITVGGGSWGLQIGGQSTDVVLVFNSLSAVQHLMSNKFRIGADASAAAGPVGRHAAVATDVALNAEILTYSRSRGAFAGVSLNGAVVQPDRSGNAALYGKAITRHEILDGSVPVPRAARPLVQDLAQFQAAHA